MPLVTDALTTVAALLQQHRAAYLQSLPARLGQLDALNPALDDPARNATTLPVLERLAHSLAGSAGTFGFRVLSDTARALELAVQALLDGDGDTQRLRESAAVMREELHRALLTALPAEAVS
jgi:HPt (histidine-containing phosphotransfer) domain-containing protein